MARLVLSCKVGWLTGLCTPSQLPVALRHSAQSLPCRQCFSSLQFKTERNNGPRVSSKKKHCDVKVDAAAVATARPETWADVMTAINAEYMDPTDICKALQSDSKRVLKSCGVRRDVTLVRLRRTARCAVARAAATHNYALYHQTQEHLSQRDAVMLGASCILAFGCAHCHVIRTWSAEVAHSSHASATSAATARPILNLLQHCVLYRPKEPAHGMLENFIRPFDGK